MRLFSLLDTQYSKYSQKVQSYLSKMLSGYSTQYGSNTIFGQIINVVGNAIQNVMLYIEDALVEQNKYTAQRKKSIYGLAAMSGYMPSFGKASTCIIKINFVPNNEGAFNVILNNRETLTCTQNGLQYNVILPQEAMVLSIVKDNSPKYLTVVQGSFETQKFVATGGKYYTQNFKFIGNLDTDYISVKINNEEWTYADSVYDMVSDGKQFTLKPSVTGGIDIVFGNDVHGRALKVNDTIDVTYLIHDGENGNLNPEIETYFVFNEQLSDTSTGEYYDGNTLFNITFAETDPVTTGSNSETLQHVSEMIGLNSRSLVLATPNNYKALIGKFGFCGYNRTWSDPNSMVVNSLIIKNFKTNIANGTDYFNLTEKDFILTDNQKNSIYNYIETSGSQLAAVKYNIFDPILCKYAMYVYIKLKSAKYNKELIKNQIRQLIGDFFTDVQSDLFIPKSDIVHLIKSNIEGVDGVDIYMLSQKNEEAIIKEQYTEDSYEINQLTGTYIKTTKNVKLYPGENPNLGLDIHGNIYLKSDAEFPVLMGNWKYYNNEGAEVDITDPLTIIFEE